MTLTAAQEKQYKKLDALLFDFGSNKMGHDAFWRAMNQNNFGQPHIDWYLKE